MKDDFASLSTGAKLLAVAVFLVFLFVIAFIAPFLVAFDGGGAMGLLIIGVALYEAWVINRRPRIEVSGPYDIEDRDTAAWDGTEGDAAAV